MKVDPRFLTSQGPEVFNGNELLIKGALETDGGVHLLGGYPGSPVAAYFDSMANIKDLLVEKGIRALMNSNEALAAAMLNGSQVVGCRGMIAMKSVGVHVAADALAIGNLAGAHPEGGAIVVCGDDPWSDSTQVPSDSRFISKHLFMPVIEPSTPQEIKDFVDLAFKVSRGSELYTSFILTTNLADGGGSVICRPNQFPSFNMRQQLTLNTSEIDLNKYVLLPPKTWWQEAKLAERFAKAIAIAGSLGLNRIEPAEDGKAKPLGFVASGMAYAYLRQALWELGLLGRYPILKFGMSYPVDAEMVRQFAQLCDRAIVVEERRSFLEEQISQIILNDRQSGKAAGKMEVWGKNFPGSPGLPDTRGLHPSMIIERLAPLLDLLDGQSASAPADQAKAQAILACRREMQTISATTQADVGNLPARTPTFCPGCPHRDSADLCLEISKRFMDARYMRRAHNSGPIDLVFHGDTGCYTMLMFPPTTPLMHDYSGMGLGGGTGSGTDPFITNKQVVFMGDGTFFHSGQLAISQAVKLGQDICFIILDNSTTGMTGHQPTSGVNYDIVGSTTPVQDIEAIVAGIGGNSTMQVVRADPQKRREYGQLLEEMFLADGVKVIIADKECGITRTRRKRRSQREIIKQQGFLSSDERMNVNTDICRFCLACSELTGCPGLRHVDTEYGRKMDTDISWCVDDGACERIGACSSFERVTIKRKRPAKSRLPELDLENIPEPSRRPIADLWRICLTGVGGMGIGLATSILVRAGHKEGYEVIFLDKKGLAIRNGGVLSQIIYNIAHEPVTAIIPYGKADLLLGVDVLEAARAIDPKGRARIASSDKTAAVINTDRIQTINGLMGKEANFDPSALEALIRRHTRSDDFLARNISRICEKYLGSKLYANIMMLGFAFQKGLVPVSLHSMAWAIKDTIRTDIRKNLYAFNMGRKLVLQSDLFQGPPQKVSWPDLLEEKLRYCIRRQGRKGIKIADQLRELIATTINSTANLDEGLKRAIVVRTYDCMRWGGMEYARQYARLVGLTYSRDLQANEYAATGAVIHNLAGAMLIKDPVFIAELATSPEKYARDREKYNVNRSNGDRIIYRHLMHPKVKIGPWTFSPAITAKAWQLKLLRQWRWLRKIKGYYSRQMQYRQKYQALIEGFVYASPREYQEKLLSLSSPYCMGCLNPTCQEAGCPIGNYVPQCLELIYQDRWQEACQKLLERNNFPEFTSRICPGFCQESCKQNLNGTGVDFRSIEAQIIDRGWAEGWIKPQPAATKTLKKVAIIGSGPSALAAAQQLARAGHAVTVFEKDAQVGGLLRYGIPAFRLDKALVDRRVDQLQAEGVTFRTSSKVGAEISARTLREDYHAVLVACGAHQPRELNVPGAKLQGVHFAMDYLRAAGQANSSTGPDGINANGKVVAVIGGGLTGEDCVESALLQGAKHVYQFEILSKPPAKSPGQAQEDDDKVTRQHCVVTRQLVGSGGKVSQLQAGLVRWNASPAGPVMQEIPDSQFSRDVDMVLLAVGFENRIAPELAEQLGIGTDKLGRPIVSHCLTKTQGVFVAGDAASGATYVATAIDAGRRAAEKINQYLTQN
jgi:indolepyruvate ferredoxin oxidoreductase